jgi:hypothetical protein
MSTWTRVNLVLALLAAALFLLDRLAGEAASSPALTALDPQRISTVRVMRDDRLSLHLERSDGAWRLAHPEAAPARTERVSALLAVARAPVVQRLASANATADYGLADPAAVLQLDSTRIAFGDRDPSLRNRYVSVDGSVAVIDELYFNLLGLPPGHFRED